MKSLVVIGIGIAILILLLTSSYYLRDKVQPAPPKQTTGNIIPNVFANYTQEADLLARFEFDTNQDYRLYHVVISLSVGPQGVPDSDVSPLVFDSITLSELSKYSFPLRNFEYIRLHASSAPNEPIDITTAVSDPFKENAILFIKPEIESSVRAGLVKATGPKSYETISAISVIGVQK